VHAGTTRSGVAIGLTRGSGRGGPPFTCFADASTDALLPRVIVPQGTSITPLLRISDLVGPSHPQPGIRLR
jgi:hypothetical protein